MNINTCTCGARFPAHLPICPGCGLRSATDRPLLEATAFQKAEQAEAKADAALKLAKEARQEAAAYRKQIYYAMGAGSAGLVGFARLYNVTGYDFVLSGVWVCGGLLVALTGVLVWTFLPLGTSENTD